MENSVRRSNREIKIRRDSDFEYDEQVLNALTKNVIELAKTAASNTRQQRIISESEAKSDSNCVKPVKSPIEAKILKNSSVLKANSWSDLLVNFSTVSDRHSVNIVNNTSNLSSAYSLEYESNPASAPADSENQNIVDEGRRESSTSGSYYIDLQGNYLSVDSNTNMSGSESEGGSTHHRHGEIVESEAAYSGSKDSPESPAVTNDGASNVPYEDQIINILKGVHKELRGLKLP